MIIFHQMTEFIPFESSRLDVFCKKCVLTNFTKFTGKHLCQSPFFNRLLKETLAQLLSCEFCEISKSTFFHRTPLVAASVYHIVRVINVAKSSIPVELTFKRTEEGCQRQGGTFLYFITRLLNNHILVMTLINFLSFQKF